MPYSAQAKNLMLDAFGTSAAYLSLHTGNPGSTGAAEVSGGSPVYARKAAAWNAASAGTKTLSNAPLFDVPPGTTVAYVGVFSAVTGGTWLGYIDTADESYTLQGTYQVTSGSVDLNAVASA